MKTSRIILPLIIVALSLSSCAASPKNKDTKKVDTSDWNIKEIYNYLSTNGDKLTAAQVAPYTQFLIDCQDPDTGNFTDSAGNTYYSLKVYNMLKRFGYEPKYPLSVCQNIDSKYCNMNGIIITEKISPETFEKWLDYIRRIEDAYGAGSSIGHFIEPHVFNLRNAGKSLDDSPYIPVLRKWLLENQGENGFWNRPDDTDYNGWNGVMKMSGGVGKAGIKLPHPDKMIKTVLKHQDTKQGTFFAGGGCSNHNALHVLRRRSIDENLIMWEDVFRAMQRHAGYVQRRYDPETGLFRLPPGYNSAPDLYTTSMIRSEAGNIIGYCRHLLKPENAEVIAAKNQNPGPNQKPITKEEIVELLVKATGLAQIAHDRYVEHVRIEHEKKYGKPAGKK